MVYQYVHDSLQVNGPDAAPLPIQVLENEAPVAALGSGFTAQQRRRSALKGVPVQRRLAPGPPARPRRRGPLNGFPVQSLLDPALLHQLQKAPFVRGPFLLSLFVSVEYIPGRGEQRFVKVLRAAEL